MCAPSSSIWAFALFALSSILVAVSALPDVPRVSVTSHHASRHWHNGTIGWDTTSDDTLSPPFVTIIASPSSTSHLMNSTVATSTIQRSSFTAQSSLPRLSLSRSLLSSTIVETIGRSKAASLAFSTRLATEASVTSSTPSSGSYDRGEEAATGSDPDSEYKSSSYYKTFGPETASAGSQAPNTATMTTFINGKTVLILPPGATRAPLSLPAVDQNTPWEVQRGLVSNATASNITGYVPPEDNSRAVAAAIIAPMLGVPGTFVVSFGIYKAIREWVFHDGAIKKAEEAKNLADVMDRMIRVQERIPLTLEEGNEIAQIENFIMMRERYNPGGTYTTNEMMQIAKVLGKDSIGFWKEPTIKGLPEGATFLAQHGESNLFGKHGQARPAPRLWPKNWGPAPPGLTSEEPDPLDPNPPATDPPEPPDEHTMSGGLGDPPPDEGVPPGNLPGSPSGGAHDGSYIGPPRVPWKWPVPGNIPLPGDDGRDADNGSNPGDDAEDQPNPPGGGDKNNDSSDDGSKDDTRTNEPKSLQSTTPTSKPRKSVHWQTPLTSNFPTTALGSGPKAPGGGADDNGASDDGSNEDTHTNEPKSRQLTVPKPITSSLPPTSVVQTTEHETLTSDIRSVKTARQPTFTPVQSLTEKNVTITGQPTSSQPPSPKGSEAAEPDEPWKDLVISCRVDEYVADSKADSNAVAASLNGDSLYDGDNLCDYGCSAQHSHRSSGYSGYPRCSAAGATLALFITVAAPEAILWRQYLDRLLCLSLWSQ